MNDPALVKAIWRTFKEFIAANPKAVTLHLWTKAFQAGIEYAQSKCKGVSR